MLHDLPGPPVGQTWIPGVTAPTWVVVVNAATDPGSADPNATIPNDPTYQPKNAHKVTVTINGGGDVAGAGGGTDVVTYSAGGTTRSPNLSTNVLSDVPTFSATRSLFSVPTPATLLAYAYRSLALRKPDSSISSG